jgi:hypothetical protein
MTHSYVCFVALLSFLGAPGQEAVLRVDIKDALTELPTACTVQLVDAQGKLVLENESFKSGFRSPGAFSKRLPPGPTSLRITRGFETRAFSTNFDLSSNQEKAFTVRLERSIDLRQLGWYAGDSHVHMLHGEKTVPVDFDFVKLTTEAEDLQWLSLAQAWTLEEPTPEALDKELRSRSTRNSVLGWNLEAPKNFYQGDAGRCLGHCWNLGMEGRTRRGRNVIEVLLAASAWDYESTKPTYANFESHNLIHSQGGTVFYTHAARWWTGPWGGRGGYPKQERMRVSNMAVELPLDTLIGPTYDGLDLFTGSGETKANAKSFQLWTLLLNHGYRLAATASSDACFDRPGGGVAGIARTYTFLPGGFSLRKAAKAIAAGKTFVTTGPLLLATVDEAPPGSVFGAGKKSHVLAIEAWAAGNDSQGLERLEILRNGEPFRNLVFEGHPEYIRTNVTFQEPAAAWYCARIFGSHPEKQVAISGAFYFEDQASRRPRPVPARVRAQLVDAESGKQLSGTLTEVTYYGTIPRIGKRHVLKNGQQQLTVPGTVRLRAEAKGYEPLTLSPFLDCPDLVRTVTEMSDAELVNWKTFERLAEQLSNIELVFRLKSIQN